MIFNYNLSYIFILIKLSFQCNFNQLILLTLHRVQKKNHGQRIYFQSRVHRVSCSGSWSSILLGVWNFVGSGTGLFMRLRFLIGCYDCRRTPGNPKSPNSAEFRSFLLIMCIDALESTTNSLSSNRILDGEGRHLFSVGEKNAALCFPFNFRIFFASFHAASRAQCSFHSVSSWHRSLNFGALVLRIAMAILLSDGFWSRSLALRSTVLVNRTHRIGFGMVELFRKIDDDLGGSTSWRNPNSLSLSTMSLHFCRHFSETFG